MGIVPALTLQPSDKMGNHPVQDFPANMLHTRCILHCFTRPKQGWLLVWLLWHCTAYHKTLQITKTNKVDKPP